MYTAYNAVVSQLSNQDGATKLKWESSFVKQRQLRSCPPLTNHITCYTNVTFLVTNRTNPSIRNDDKLEVRFVAFYKRFVLVLYAERTHHKAYPYNHNMTVTVIKKTGRRTVNHSFEDYFSGHLDGDPLSMFHGRYNDGILNGIIYTPVETYYIEPRGKYFNVVGRRNEHRAVVYRERDMTWAGPETLTHMAIKARNHDCWGRTSNRTLRGGRRYFNEMRAREGANETFAKSRQRRQNIRATYSICELSTVVDPAFYKEYCEGSYEKTIDTIMFVVRLADHAFRRIDFDEDNVGDNIGFAIRELIIYTSDDAPGYICANMTNSRTIMHKFAKYDFGHSCLAVLFTHRAMDHNIAGLAFTGCESMMLCVGGMCNKRIRRGGHMQSYNVLIVSSLRGDIPYTRRAVATTLTHEVGHAFGAGHDITTECLADDQFGVFLMFPTYASETKPNSFVFSPCSLRDMRPVVKAKGFCLKTYARESYCGNFVKESSEQCDCGTDELVCHDYDKCCVPPSDEAEEPGCRIAVEQGYVCSPKVSLCCTADCKVETEKRECRARTECTQAVNCNSMSVECPQAEPVPDGEPCAGGVRVCSHGACIVGRCEAHGWHNCHCSGASDELCQLCCSTDNTTETECKPAYKLSDTDNVREPIYMTTTVACNKKTGYCDKDHVCVVVIPPGDKYLTVIMMRSYWKNLGGFMAGYYYVLLILILSMFALLTLGLALRCCRSETLNGSAYRSGIEQINVMLLASQTELAEQRRELDWAYAEALKRADGRAEGADGAGDDLCEDYVVGYARLRMFFPTAPGKKISRAAQHSNCEELAVRRLLMQGYPLNVWDNNLPDETIPMEDGTRRQRFPADEEMVVTKHFILHESDCDMHPFCNKIKPNLY